VASARINPRPLASAPRVRRQSAYSGPEINATTSVSTAPIGRGGMQRAWPQDHGNGIRCVFHVVLLMEAERHCCASPRSRTQPVSGALRADPAEFKSMACRTGKGDSFDVFLKKKSKLCGAISSFTDISKTTCGICPGWASRGREQGGSQLSAPRSPAEGTPLRTRPGPCSTTQSNERCRLCYRRAGGSSTSSGSIIVDNNIEGGLHNAIYG